MEPYFSHMHCENNLGWAPDLGGKLSFLNIQLTDTLKMSEPRKGPQYDRVSRLSQQTAFSFQFSCHFEFDGEYCDR